MAFSKDTYDKADREIKRRLNEALSERERRHSEAVAKVPELLVIEDAMAQAGLATIKAVGMGNGSEDFIKKLAEINLDAQDKRRKLLVANGFTEDWLDVRYTCPKCKDKGSVGGYACECYKLLLRSIEYEKLCSKLPVNKCRFDNFKLDYYPEGAGISPRRRMESVLGYCKAYADDFSLSSPSLLLYGKTGLGKTHLSLAIAGKAVEAGYGVIYMTAQNLFNRLEREKFGRGDGENTEQAILDCDLLIIDDLGSEFSTQLTVSALYNIVNCRGLEEKPTIISTNLVPDELKSTYSDRIASRILSAYTILQFDGADIRQLKTL
ncbi:MAG: ATP-binding protein [Acutalibacteraceae bacterium]|nr:ATP-binding protein [Acutalibacteraceae bacterium]